MMKLFLFNILLAVLWMFMWGAFDIYTLLAGFVLGYLLLGLYSRTLETEGYGTKGWQLLSFAVYFVRILVKANLQVAQLVIQPRLNIAPRIVRYPVKGLTDAQVATLASSITLTPGTLSMDISDDGEYLYIHCVSAQDREAAIRDLDELRDRLLAEVF